MASSRSFCDDAAAAVLHREQRGLIDHVGQLGAAGTGARTSDGVEVDRRRALHILGMDTQDRFPASQIRQLDRDPAVKTTWAKQRRIQRFRTVGRRQDDDALAAVKPIHFCKQLIQRLLTFIIAAESSAVTLLSDRIDLIDEDDARSLLTRLLEQVTHLGRASADKHLDELTAADGEKRHTGFSGHRLGQQRLARSRRTDQQSALRHLRADLLISFRMIQEVHDLLQRFLRLILTSHILEGLAALRRHIDLGIALA